MNIDNLHIGDVIKNYYALCDEIEEPIKSGKSKKYQLEDFMKSNWITKFILAQQLEDLEKDLINI